MPTTKNEALAQRFQAVPPPPEDAIRIEPVPPRQRVVYATNTDSDWRIGVIVLLVFLVASGFLGYALGRSLEQRIIIGALCYVPLAMFAMLAITGHLPALWESWQGERTERRRIDVDAQRIETHGDIVITHLENEAARDEQQHAERMAQIASDQETQRLYLAQDAAEPMPDSWVAGVPEEARVAVRRWLDTCYTGTGYNPDTVETSGKVKRHPWSKNGPWKGQPWCADAQRLANATVLAPFPTGNEASPMRQLRFSIRAEAQQAVPLHGPHG